MMSICNRFAGLVLLVVLPAFSALSQTATWVGAIDDKWRTAGNWSPVGVPDENTDVIINFIPGNNQCTLKKTAGVGRCKSLTIGTGAFATEFTEDDGLFVYGDITIGANGTFTDDGGILRVEGNWINNGTYSIGGPNRRVDFIGSNQTIGGSSVTDFGRLYINSGSTITLAQNVIVSRLVELSGTLDPTPSFFMTVGTNDINIRSGGELRVKASTYAGNYSAGSANSASNTAVINYASTTVNQTIDPSETYDILKISGSMTKSLSANTTITRDLLIEGGTLDLQTFTANRNSSGGSLTMAAGTTLKIGGTNTFPSNYSSILLATTSTVEYKGANQTVQALSYGNLILSATGTATKTMPGAAFTVAGNLTSSTSAGTLSYTAANNITVGGNINIGASTVFTSTAFSHSFGGNWVNNGTYNGCGSTVTSSGAGVIWSGASTAINNFGNVVIAGNGTLVNANVSLSLCGNFSTSGGGTFIHTTGGTGTFTMTGASKTISGSNIVLDDLIVAGGGSVSTVSPLVIAGNLTTTGSFTATAGSLSLTGASKSVTGAGALQFFALNVPGSISTNKDLSISSNFSIAGSFTASAGTTTFNGTSTLSGTANLFNISIPATRTLIMGASSILGIANTVSAGGTFTTSTNVPNTVNYNGTGAQAFVLSTFNNLIVSNGNTKTPPSGLTISGNFTIGSATTFVGGTFSHTLGGSWINSGTFTANTSTFTLTGNNDVTMTGATTFNNLTINKGVANNVTLNNNISALNLAMAQGTMLTGSNTITITATRTGTGIIIGRVTRTHAYGTGVNYTFEGPNNFINFSNVGSGITSITVLIEKTIVGGFPSGSPINRKYTVTVSGTGYTATMRLHYEEIEVNGNAEGAMSMWTDQGIATWVNRFKSNHDTGANWVEQTGLTDIQNGWTLSDGQNVLAWSSTAVSAVWSNPANWTTVSGTPGPTPTINDIVLLGDRAVPFQPTLNSAAQTKGITFGSASAITLTIGSGGSLTVQGNIEGTWSSDMTHTIAVGAQTLTTFSDLELSKGVANRRINVTVSTGTINVSGSLVQSGNADITFTDAGVLNIGGDYNYTTGTFTPATGSVKYNGINDQVVAPLTYHHLNIDKAFGVASTVALTSVTGNLIIGTSGGQLDLGGTLNVTGNVLIGTGAILNSISSPINVAGNWTTTGTFIPGLGTVTFNGGGAQTVNATTFNDLAINKSGGTLHLLGNLGVNGNVNVQAGTVDISTFFVSRSVAGGVLTIGPTGIARAGGAGFQLVNFVSLMADPTSTVEFYGGSSRPIPPVVYGNLIISDGGTKVLIGPTVVGGNLTINPGATLQLPTSTLTLSGNMVNNGTLDATPGSLILGGTTKTLSGNGFTSKELIVTGSYTTSISSGSLIINNNFDVLAGASFDVGSTTATVHGNLTNSGTLTLNGIATFSGLQAQTIQLNSPVTSGPSGVVNFNGTVAPIFNSTATPTLATVNINNTASINPSQPWTVAVLMNVAAGATWNGGALDHNINGSFTNNGTVTSNATITFGATGLPAVTINLGNNFVTTGNVVFGGTAAITLVDNTPNFASVRITNTNAVGVTAATNWMVSQDLFIGLGAELKGGTGLTHRISGEWTNNGTFTGGTSTVIFDSNSGLDELKGGGTNNFYNLTFDAGADMAVTTDIAISQHFTNDAAALDLLNSEVTFSGSTLSILGGASQTVFEEIVINKSATGVRMDNNVNVGFLLTLTDGELNLNGNTLLITDPAPGSIVRTNGYILSENTTYNSVLSWVIGTDANPHVFPFGTSAATYIPVTFDLSTGDAGTVSLATYPTAANNSPLPPGVAHVRDALGADNSANTVDRFWSISLAGETTPNADITLSASATEVGTITTLLGQRWNGTFWDTPLPAQISGATTVTVPGVTTFSTWAISGNNVPLPITLVSLKARQIGNRVSLDWITASEINNDYFEIEKSIDGTKFFAIDKVEGAINSTETRTYTFSDTEINQGMFFYRLKQVDLDKQFTYSPIVSVRVGEVVTSNISFSVYPNPTVETLFITHEGLTEGRVIITLLDGSGRLISRSERWVEMNDGPLELDVRDMKPGYYVIQAIADGKSTSFRILKSE